MSIIYMSPETEVPWYYKSWQATSQRLKFNEWFWKFMGLKPNHRIIAKAACQKN